MRIIWLWGWSITADGEVCWRGQGGRWRLQFLFESFIIAAKCLSAVINQWIRVATYPSSFLPVPVFLRFGEGIRHSMPKAVQLVHGTPKLAASQRTYDGESTQTYATMLVSVLGQHSPYVRDMSDAGRDG